MRMKLYGNNFFYRSLIVVVFTLGIVAIIASGGGGGGDDEQTTCYYLDSDGDGYGDSNTSVERENQPSGYVTNSSDCDDSDKNVYPGAEEICDFVDNDCDGVIDEEFNDSCTKITYYLDNDNDGYGDPDTSLEDYNQPSGYVTSSNDCNDEDENIHPGAEEICDHIDNDCDGDTDEGFNDSCTRITYYLDSDEDGYGDPNQTTENFTQPLGYVLNNDDCDDSDENINPSAEEICDHMDNDCDGDIDEGFNDSCTKITFYLDSDNDGYGDISSSIEDYIQPEGYVTNSNDCDDSNENINPGAEEVCDKVDNNCNGSIDEGFNESCTEYTYYYDSDEDGYGDPDTSIVDYTQPSGYVQNSSDCDDTDENINPSADEVCDDIDNNCNGDIDEGFNESCQHVLTLTATEDTHTDQFNPSTNYGDESYVKIGVGYTGFIKFDFSSIPEDADIVEAKLYLQNNTYYVSDPPSGTITIYQISESDWDEHELTYANMPTEYSRYVTKYKDASDGSITWEMTNFVSLWLEDPNYGLRIEMEIDSGAYSNWMFESGPTLEIVYTVGGNGGSI